MNEFGSSKHYNKFLKIHSEKNINISFKRQRKESSNSNKAERRKMSAQDLEDLFSKFLIEY